MNKKLWEKTREALTSVLPITVIVFILSVVLVPIDIGTAAMFIAGAALLILGMGLFSLGTDMSMMPMGEGIGVQLTQSKKLILVAVLSFCMGMIITIAEPDLQVLANQVPSIPNMVLILTVAIGVGLFLVAAIFRILFRIPLSTMLIFFYGLVFIVSIFTPNDFVAVAFDSGGVTTGPITVPFIMAMGLGLASVRSDKDSADDSFGLVALSSIGPILAVQILGIVYNPESTEYTQVVSPVVSTTRDLVREFLIEMPHYIREVTLAITPILAFFIIFQLSSRRFHRKQLYRIGIGLIYTFIGLILFLTGVNVGFIPVGHLLGSELASASFRWLLVPLGMLIGYFIVAAEPAVHVLNRQVEEISNGAISQSSMNRALSIGVSVSLGLSMLRILLSISIYWFLVPGYLIAIVLTFFVPKIFTGIAFDSGGVVSGPMTSTFLLPFAIGACEAMGGNVLTDAFGVVAMVAMTPLIAIQVMGLLYQKRMADQVGTEDLDNMEDDEIINYEEDDSDE